MYPIRGKITEKVACVQPPPPSSHAGRLTKRKLQFQMCTFIMCYFNRNKYRTRLWWDPSGTWRFWEKGEAKFAVLKMSCSPRWSCILTRIRQKWRRFSFELLFDVIDRLLLQRPKVCPNLDQRKGTWRLHFIMSSVRKNISASVLFFTWTSSHFRSEFKGRRSKSDSILVSLLYAVG